MSFFKTVTKIVGDAAKAPKKASEKSKKTGPAAKQESSAVLSMKPWSGIYLIGAVQVGGNYENTIYTYDSTPLKGIRKGQSIIVELYCGECVMKSPSTGLIWDSEAEDDVAVLYNGAPFGFTTIPKEKVREAARLGYALRFEAKCHGMLEGYKDIKEMTLVAPHPLYLYDIIPGAPDDRPLSDRDGYFAYNVYNEKDFKEIATKDHWVFQNAKLEMIPTPEKSTAKPHIGVYSSSGTLLSEVTARHSYYNDLIGYMNHHSQVMVEATRYTNNFSDSVYYKIEMIGN